MNGILRRHPTPVFNGDLVVFVPIGDHPAPTVATHTLWPLFPALNFISAPCPVPRATLAEAIAGPAVGVVAWGRQLRERASLETEGGHSELLIFTPAGVLRAAVSDTPPSAAQVVNALGPVLADLLGAGTVSDVQRAFGDRSVFIFRPDALDIRLTIAIRQDGGSLLALVLSRPEYMTSGTFFAASHSVSAEEQAHVDSSGVPVLWPNVTGSLDFYNEHDEPSAEPVPARTGYPEHFTRHPNDALGYGGYNASEGNSSAGSVGDEEEVDAGAIVAVADSEPEPGPGEPTATDLAAPASSTATEAVDSASREGSVSTSLLQVRAFRSRAAVSVPTPFGRRSLEPCAGPPHDCFFAGAQASTCHTGIGAGHESTGNVLPHLAPHTPEIVGLVQGLAGQWDGFLRGDTGALPCLSDAHKRACAHRPLEGYVAARHAFVDGALYKGRDKHRGGWAAVVVAEWHTPQGTVFAFDGYAGGPLVDFAKRPLQAEYSSYDAEAAAMLVVLTWHLAQPEFLLRAVHFDANAVGQAAEGLAAPRDPGEGFGLAGRARCVAQLLEAQGRAPQYSWLKGHAGILWNEVADRLAKAFALEALPATALPEPFWQFVASRSLPWAWLVADRSGAFPDVQQLSEGVYESPDPIPSDCMPIDPEQHGNRSSGELGLSLMSLNVQTLQDKRPIVLQQLQDKRTLLCGLQETRSRYDSMCSCGGFLEFASAAQAGEGGCTLLVSTTVPYVRMEDRPLCLARQHCRCAHASPQLLAVEIRAPFFQCVCVVGHLPHTGRPVTEVQAWWAELASHAWFRSAGAVIMLLDANAQLGSVVSEAVGPHAQEVENVAGTLFREFLEVNSLCAPATFHGVCGECIRSASEPTWTSPRGFSRRIDYMLSYLKLGVLHARGLGLTQILLP